MDPKLRNDSASVQSETPYINPVQLGRLLETLENAVLGIAEIKTDIKAIREDVSHKPDKEEVEAIIIGKLSEFGFEPQDYLSSKEDFQWVRAQRKRSEKINSIALDAVKKVIGVIAIATVMWVGATLWQGVKREAHSQPVILQPRVLTDETPQTKQEE